MRFEPRPRVVDWTLLLAVLVAFATGLGSAFAGRPDDAWVFAVHGVAGIVLVVALAWKLRRVAPRIRRPARSRSTLVSVLALVLAVSALGSGFAWVFGWNVDLLRWNLMNLHVLLGLLLLPALAVHLRDRFRLPRTDDLEGRRTALQYLLLVGGGTLAWRTQNAIVGTIESIEDGRFTGSRDESDGAGNAFPATSWVADDPDPVDPGEWSLRVVGAVEHEYEVGYDGLADARDEERAILDCTSGWYAERSWEGVRIGRLLDRASVEESARWVSFRSVTGYRWSLPIGEARDALLATAVGGETLSHEHGFPARLVAPGRRGFQWVKWVESIEIRTRPDYGQWIAIFASGFD